MGFEDNFKTSLALRDKLLECMAKKRAGLMEESKIGLYEIIWSRLYQEIDILLRLAATQGDAAIEIVKHKPDEGREVT